MNNLISKRETFVELNVFFSFLWIHHHQVISWYSNKLFRKSFSFYLHITRILFWNKWWVVSTLFLNVSRCLAITITLCYYWCLFKVFGSYLFFLHFFLYHMPYFYLDVYIVLELKLIFMLLFFSGRTYFIRLSGIFFFLP